MEYNRSEYKYIYNLMQINYLIQNGAKEKLIKIDRNPSSSKTYAKFINDDEFNLINGKWINRN